MIRHICKKNTQFTTQGNVSLFLALSFAGRIRNVLFTFPFFFIYLTTRPLPLPKRVPHRVRSSASYSNYQYLSLCLRSSSSCLRLLPRLPVTSILSAFLPSITCFRRQFLRKMWRIQLAFLLFILCKIFLSSLTPHNNSISHTIGPTDLHPSPANTFQNFIYISDLLSEASNFEHHIKFWSKYSIFLFLS